MALVADMGLEAETGLIEDYYRLGLEMELRRAQSKSLRDAVPGEIVEWEIRGHQFASVGEYIETLERAVLGLWPENGVATDLLYCQLCQEHAPSLDDNAIPHAPGCIVPALLAKYAT